MPSDYEAAVERAVTRLVEAGVASPDEVDGCSASDRRRIERTLNVELPTAYAAFLDRVGNGCGHFLKSEEFRCPEVPGLKEGAQSLVDELDIEGGLTDDDVVFLGHRGYVYLYFDASKGANPPVYRIMEGEPEAERVVATFTDWLTVSVEDEIELHADPERAVSMDDLRTALKWTREDPDGRFLSLVFDHDGAVDGHYQIAGGNTHNATRLSEEEVDHLQTVCADRGLAVATRGDSPAGTYLTFDEGGDAVDEQLGIILAVLRDVYGASIDDLEAIERTG